LVSSSQFTIDLVESSNAAHHFRNSRLGPESGERRFMEWADRRARRSVVPRPDALAANTNGVRRWKWSVSRVAAVNRYQRKTVRESTHCSPKHVCLVVFRRGYLNIDLHYIPKKSSEEILSLKAGCRLACQLRYAHRQCVAELHFGVLIG